MEQTLVILWVMLLGPILLFFVNRMRVAGKILCVILDEDRSVRTRLVKVEGDYLNVGENRYIVNPDAVRLMRYPAGWPIWLQQIVPTCLYKVEEAEALDWNTQLPIVNSSSALSAVMEPHWLKLIVKGTKEGGEGGLASGSKLLIVVGLGVSVLVLVLMFYVISRLISIESLVSGVGG